MTVLVGVLIGLAVAAVVALALVFFHRRRPSIPDPRGLGTSAVGTASVPEVQIEAKTEEQPLTEMDPVALAVAAGRLIQTACDEQGSYYQAPPMAPGHGGRTHEYEAADGTLTVSWPVSGAGDHGHENLEILGNRVDTLAATWFTTEVREHRTRDTKARFQPGGLRKAGVLRGVRSAPTLRAYQARSPLQCKRVGTSAPDEPPERERPGGFKVPALFTLPEISETFLTLTRKHGLL